MTEEAETEVPLLEEVARRLDLITQTPGAVLKYDANGDGVLDGQEWEVLRSIVEAEVVRERSGEDPEEDPWTVEEELDDPHVDLPVLEVIDKRYEILREIGRGTQGTTLFARRRSDSHYVAVKELAFDNLESWKSLELFEREAEVLRGLDHPRIPSFVDSFSVDIDDSPTRFFLVQSFVSGSSLDVLLAQRERIGERQVLEFARGVLEMLHYLHTRHPPVVHRDVKPSNLIRGPDGAYSLVDFGGAQIVLPSDVGGSTIIGTTGYMPPEQLTGRACPESDLYALGATMVHLVTHISPSALPTSRLKLDWQDRSNLTPPVADFIDRLIEPVVEDRYSSAREALKHIEMLLGGTTAMIRNPDADMQRSLDDVALRKADFLATAGVPRDARYRKQRRGDTIVYDLAARRTVIPGITGAMFMVIGGLLAATVATSLGLFMFVGGVALIGLGSQRQSEELHLLPQQGFELHVDSDDDAPIRGTINSIEAGKGHLRLTTHNESHRIGAQLSPDVLRWLRLELALHLATDDDDD